MADRYPLVYNSSANQLQELQSGDSLDVGNSSIKGATGYATTTGTSSQFLKADGSTDSNTYLTSAGTVALAEGLTGSPSINVSAVSGTTGTFSGAVSGTNGTFSGNVSAVNVSASSSVTAATFYGDGQNLTNTGSTLSASSGIQRVVLTGQTSGTMTSSATDSDFTYDSSSNTLNVQNLNVQGTTTTIDTAITAVDSLNVDGSVGIGTTNTLTTKLHVQGTGNGSSGSSSVSDSSEASAVLLKPLPTSGTAMALGARGSGGHYIQGLYAASPVTVLRDISINPYGGSVGIGTLSDNFAAGASATSTVKIATTGVERLRITGGGDVLIGGHSARTYDDTGDTNVILDVYGGSTSGKRGILSLSGRTNGDVGDLGTIWFNNNDNSGAGVGTQMKLSAAMQAKSVTSDSNADNDAGANLRFYTKPEGGNLAERLHITSDGHILPGADDTQDLGSSSARFANIYTGDLNLSNEGSANDVDGTWGQFTIQEGEDDLFLINRRTGKKYKFNLTEVD